MPNLKFALCMRVFALLMLGMWLPSARAQVSFTSVGATYTQNFDVLATTGASVAWADNATILGWYSNRATYNASTGSSNAGSLYSFGTVGSTDRALGGVASGGTGSIYWALRVANNTGVALTSLAVSYSGEQWRDGGNTTPAAQSLQLQYQVAAVGTITDADTPTTGWLNAASLGFSSPVQTTVGAALDGNASTNRAAISGTLTVTVPVGQEIWLRWVDINDSGNDHGLAIDDVSITANGTTAAAPSISIDNVSLAEGDSGTSNAVFNVSLSSAAPAGGVTFDIATADGTATIANSDYVARSLTAQSIPEGQTSYQFTVVVNGDLTVESNETFFVNLTNVIGATVADGQGQATITNDDVSLVPINQIQGAGAASPLLASNVKTRGIVTAAYPGFRGFYIQSQASDEDADPATSEGIFVFMNSATLPAAAAVGNLVEVSGIVGEFGTAPTTATQLGSSTDVPVVTLISTSNALPAPIAVTLPLASSSALERYEGMRVSFAQSLTVSGNFTLGRFGEVVLSANGRLVNPSNVIDLNDVPASGNTIVGSSNVVAITAALDAARLNQVTLDDATSAQNPDPAPFGLSAANPLRAGSTISGVTGVVNQITQGYRVLSDPSNPPAFNRAPRPSTPPAVGGTLKAAGFNVLNYFNGNGSNQDGAAGGYPTARGANNFNEFNRQRAKTIAAVNQLGADVVGVIEMENDGDAPESALSDLLSGLSGVDAAAQWSRVALPAGWGTLNGSTDQITTRLIYKNASVEPVGAPLFCDSPAFVNARTPLAQVFRSRSTGGKVIVSINHFKSKSCGSGPDAASGAEADQNDGQSCWAPRRLAQAQALISCVSQWQTSTGENRVLLLGDFNAYEQENAIDAFRAAGLVTLINDSYSFVFDAQSGALDHAIASPQLVSQITGADKWHINADEPISLDYNTEFKTVGQQTSLYAADPFRSSDHDPALVGMNLASDPAVVTITSVTSGAVFGQPVNVAVSVSGFGVPTGTVNVAVGTASCSITLAAGSGNCNLAGIAVGAGQTVSATYAGDVANGAGSDTDTVTVIKANTTATITANTPNPSIVNSPVSVSVSIAPVAPGAGSPSGTITVSDGAASCVISLPASSCTITPTTTGVKTLSASYAGDASFNASSAPGVLQTVNAAPVSPVITNPAPPPSGESALPYAYQFTATGNAPITFSVSAGSLPPGLTLTPSGLLSGTPTAPGSYTFTVTAANGVLPNATQQVNLVVGAGVGALAIPSLSATWIVAFAVLLVGIGAISTRSQTRSERT